MGELGASPMLLCEGEESKSGKKEEDPRESRSVGQLKAREAERQHRQKSRTVSSADCQPQENVSWKPQSQSKAKGHGVDRLAAPVQTRSPGWYFFF